ncbi:MAG: DUF2807 domain-containing protein [Bacteroidetes bacterium]|nr:DUF2807 domain-containing protein [Bacteroidota bacterium]
MKKSNIILLTIFILIVVVIVALQFRIKSFVINKKEIQLDYREFNKIEVEIGWEVELHKDTTANVIIFNDSLQHLISVQDHKLIFKNNNGKYNAPVKVLNSDIKSITTYGESRVYYYNDSIDSLELTLYNQSAVKIRPRKITDNATTDSLIISGNINYLNFKAFGSSKVNISNHVKALEGELNDTTMCSILGKVNIIKLEKSENSAITSW